jgi:hypothetical protein
MSNPLYNSIKVYIILIIIIIFIKPELIYDKKNNKFKSFGTKKNQTLLSFHVIAIILAFILYIFFLLLDKIQNKNNNNLNIPYINQHNMIPQIYPQPYIQYYYPQYEQIQ